MSDFKPIGELAAEVLCAPGGDDNYVITDAKAAGTDRDCGDCGCVLNNGGVCTCTGDPDCSECPRGYLDEAEDLAEEGEALEEELKGGAKQLDGKLPVELVPWLPVLEVARVLQFGANKYDDWNWYKGLPITTCMGSALRHCFKFMMGEDNDDESGLPHLAHACCNIMFALQFFKEGRGDNRPAMAENQYGMVSPINAELWDNYTNVMNLDK